MTALHDVAIVGGRVIDPETSMYAVRNVGVSDGKIVAITTDEIGGKTTIDANGLVVAPGFIDTHFHPAGNPWAAKVALRNGVTTVLDTEFGAINVGKWYDERIGELPVNFGVTASHEMHRMRVLDQMDIAEAADANNLSELRAKSYDENAIPDWAETIISPEQLVDVLSGLDQELAAGAIGIGSTVGYMPMVTTFELFEVQKVAANYGRLFANHVRFLGQSKPPTEGVLGVLEQIANGVALNQPILISHNHSYGWWEIEDRLARLRDLGFNAWSEYYPYAAGSTTIGSDFLKPENIAKLGMDYTNLLNPMTGEYMDRDEYDQIVAEDPGAIVVGFVPGREEWIPLWLQVPHMTAASDAMPSFDADGNLLGRDDTFEAYSGHPRTAGTQAKVLRLAREHDVPLLHAIAQLSYWSALHLGDAGMESMRTRGRLQVGMTADITVFDPETVTDNASYALGENGLPSTGIPHVIVNGVVAVSDSEVLDGNPGQPIRYPTEATGRFEPPSREDYVNRLFGRELLDSHDHGLDHAH